MLRPTTLAILTACAPRGEVHPAEHSSAPCPSRIGDPAAYTLRGRDMSAPQTCMQSQPREAYIRIAGGGTRNFTQEHGRGCTRIDDAACTEIDFATFLEVTHAKLRERGILAAWGIGRCGRLPLAEGWENQHWAFTIYEWKDANETVALVAEELEKWKAAQSFEVSVEEMACGELL